MTMIRFREHFSLTVSGPSGIGKSSLILKLLQNANKCFTKEPTCVYICYGVESGFYQEFTKLPYKIILNKGVPANEDHEKNSPSKSVLKVNDLLPNSLVIFDDLQSEAEKICDYFTKYRHHLSLSIIYLTQNIYLKQNRTITLNSQYIILFTTFRDKTQIQTLANQIDPGQTRWIVKSFKDISRQKYSYILFDFTPDSHDSVRVRDSVLPLESHYFVNPLNYDYFDLRPYIREVSRTI